MMNDNKVCIGAFIFNLSKGGAQGVFVTVVNCLKKQGFHIEVIVQSLEDSVYREDIDAEIPVTNLQVDSAKKLLPNLRTYIEQHHLDYAMAFSPEIAVNLYFAKKLCQKNFIIYARCINTLSYEYQYTKAFFRKYVTNTLLKLFYHRVDYLIAQSQGMASDLCKNYHFRPEQVKVINNALGRKFEIELDQNVDLEKENIILYSGRLEKQKGLEMLLTALARMEDKNVKLVLVGSGSEKEALQKLSRELGVFHRVRFVEYTKEIIQYYKKAKLTVLSSYFEGFPNVLIESIACGTPVVSFDLPSGPSEIVINEENGYLVEYLNVSALAEAIDKALRRDWNPRVVKETVQRFRADVIMQQYLDLF